MAVDKKALDYAERVNETSHMTGVLAVAYNNDGVTTIAIGRCHCDDNVDAERNIHAVRDDVVRRGFAVDMRMHAADWVARMRKMGDLFIKTSGRVGRLLAETKEERAAKKAAAKAIKALVDHA